MKRNLIIGILLILSLRISAQEMAMRDSESVSHDYSSDKNVMKFNALSLIVGTGSIFYERELTELVSGQMGIGIIRYNLMEDIVFNGLIFTPELKIYPRHDPIDGFYIGPYLRYQQFSAVREHSDYDVMLRSYGGGLVLGSQWITRSGFVIDLFFGGHYARTNSITKSGNEDREVDNFFNGLRTRMGVAIGFSF